jgi:hypothetical protein
MLAASENWHAGPLPFVAASVVRIDVDRSGAKGSVARTASLGATSRAREAQAPFMLPPTPATTICDEQPTPDATMLAVAGSGVSGTVESFDP